MRFTKFEKDWLIIDEENYENVYEKNKIHLIEIAFKEPTLEKIDTVIERFPNTNRFIVYDNVKFYNNAFKNLKKYYVGNKKGDSLISFFRKNNKVLLNMINLSYNEWAFIIDNFDDVLRNIEVIRFDDIKIPSSIIEKLKRWNGNVLI